MGGGAVYVHDRERSHTEMLTVGLPIPRNSFAGAALAAADDLVVVGAPREGAAYVFSGAARPAQRHRLVGGDAATNRFGEAVATGAHEHRSLVVVGAPGIESAAGSSYVFVPRRRYPEQFPTPLFLAGATPGFGAAVATDGEIVAIGSPDRDGVGVVEIFELDEDRNGDPRRATLVATLAPDDGAAGWDFGSAVAIGRGRIVVGAQGADGGAGAAYVFAGARDGFAPRAKLAPDDLDPDGRFGASVAVGSYLIAVGTQPWGDGPRHGSVRVFDHDFAEVSELLPGHRTTDDGFGRSVAVTKSPRSGADIVVVGSPGYQSGTRQPGAVHVFSASHPNQGEFERTTVEGGGGFFGRSVAIPRVPETGALHVLVGAPFAGGTGGAFVLTGVADVDGDGVGDGDDNCPDVSNPAQDDADGNDVGDACEPEPTISLSAAGEGSGPEDVDAGFTVRLDRPAPFEVTVRFATRNGSARAPGDYRATSVEVRFGPGDQEVALVVPVADDEVDERFRETFHASLSEAEGGTIDVGWAPWTIVDDEPGPRISVADATVAEGDQGQRVARVPLRLDSPSEQAVKVRVSTRDRTARAGSDYVARSTWVTFPAGTTEASFPVAVRGDRLREPDERFEVRLTQPRAGARLADSSALVTIRNDDG